jgi:GNAT superfamily N-acetyltransferase
MVTHRLANGQQVVIRPIAPDDKWRLQEGLKQLSLDTVRRRFLAAKPRFSSSELRYLTEVDGVNHIALVAISVTTGRLVAVARAVRLPEDPEAAEWAIVVADPLQRQGLGTRLMELLVAEALAHGIHRFSALMAGENRAVGRLLAHAHAHYERDVISGGFREVTVDLTRPLAA